MQRHHSAGLVCSSQLDFSSGPLNYLISESRTLEHPVVHPPPFLYLDSKEETVVTFVVIFWVAAVPCSGKESRMLKA